MITCVDLFSGLGGFSQAFVDRGHEVERYDFDEKFKEVPHTTIKNVLELTPIDLEHADIILASPPCNHFSVASVYVHWKHGVPTEATKKQIEMVKKTIMLIEEANPKYWILENPRGMLRKVIGKPAHTAFWAAYGGKTLKPTDLWGKLPPIDRKLPFKWERAPRGQNLGIQGVNVQAYKKNVFSYVIPGGGGNSALRALIPYDFSLAVCLAAEGNSPQTTISDFS